MNRAMALMLMALAPVLSGPPSREPTACCLCECGVADQARCAERCVPEKTRSKRGQKKCVRACKQILLPHTRDQDDKRRAEFELARAIAKLDADQVVQEIAQRIPGFEVEGDRVTISERAMRRILLLLEESDLWREGKR